MSFCVMSMNMDNFKNFLLKQSSIFLDKKFAWWQLSVVKKDTTRCSQKSSKCKFPTSLKLRYMQENFENFPIYYQ